MVEELLAQAPEELRQVRLAVRIALPVGQGAEGDESVDGVVQRLADGPGTDGGERRDGVPGGGGEDVSGSLEEPRGLGGVVVGSGCAGGRPGQEDRGPGSEQARPVVLARPRLAGCEKAARFRQPARGAGTPLRGRADSRGNVGPSGQDVGDAA